ncbi:MAG TPA: GlsB/YeaQ/YmgE family stress response membrane protein [Ilumatobacteraceae bacterium]|nr:GlsB/YeaQ/YmgE family stress response membrane protein [Ilumatobacteraceae bacterium]
MLILALIGIGMLIGWVGQVILGMGTRFDGRTLIAGLLGSFVGGLLASLIAGDGLHLRLSGLIGSIIGAIIVLAIWRSFDRKKAQQVAAYKKESRSGDPRKRTHRA